MVEGTVIVQVQPSLRNLLTLFRPGVEFDVAGLVDGGVWEAETELADEVWIVEVRSLRVAGVQRGERVGLYEFGSSASLAIRILQSWDCEVYVVTRGKSHRKTAESLGATWVGNEDAKPPIELDRAVTFAPSGKVVVSALSSLRKGGVVAINAVHLDQMPAFDYDKLLWGERQMRSVANMTRQDAHDFIALAHDLKIRPAVATFSLQDANKALTAVKHETNDGSAVIVL